MSSQSLDNILNSAPMAETQSGFYRTIDFYTGGSSRMYSGPLNYGPIPASSGSSGFTPASNYGIGPGIAKKDENGLIERYRAGKHEKYGEDHVNLEYYIVDQRLFNLHINMKDKKDDKK